MAIYRKMYEQHFGPIPKDEDGRSYEIHHIDGNNSNNDIQNLKCVTIKEHYDIHYAQEDWAACLLISLRMNVSPELKSELSRKTSLYYVNKRVNEGTHHFLGGEIQRNVQNKRVKSGEHHWLSGELQREHQLRRSKEGTHQFLGGEIQRRNNLRRVAEGKHNFQDSEATRARTYRQIANGKHASQLMKTCEHCQKEVDSANYSTKRICC